MRAGLGSLGAARVLPILALVAAGLFLVPKLVDKAGEEASAPPTFKRTLAEVREDFGEDARVLSISEIGGTVSYAVIDGDIVRERTYSIETSEVRGPQGQPAQGREKKVDDRERPPTRKELATAAIALGDLDEDVVVRMWEEVGFPTQGSSASLAGQEWVLSSGSRPFDRYVANADGSGIRQTKSKKDTFGGSPPDRIGSFQSLAKCIEAAGSDVAAIQRCQATAH